MTKPAGLLLIPFSVLIAASMGCSFITSIINPATPTATTPAPSATSTATPLTPTATSTPLPSATPSENPAATGTEIPGLAPGTATLPAPSTGVAFPVTFNITLNAPATVCGDAISSAFTVTLTESTISMYQIEYQLTTSGPYDPANGSFTSTRSGLPGTQTYSGVLTLTPGSAGTVVTMNGQFTYTGDPEYTCPVADVFSGNATITP